MIDEQSMNLLSWLLEDTQAFLNAFLALQDRYQEAFDRDVDTYAPTWEYPLPGDLDHLTLQKLSDAFTAYNAVLALMTANERALFSVFYGMVR